MIPTASVEKLKEGYRRFKSDPPELHVVLGTGFGSALSQLGLTQVWSDLGEIVFTELPDLRAATTPGHRGSLRYFKHQPSGKTLCLQMGRLHGYEGIPAREVVKTVMSARLAGTRKFILTNAAGSLSRELDVGSVMLLSDHVNLTGQNPLAGENPGEKSGTPLGPRFPDMGEVYDRKLRSRIKQHLVKQGLAVNEGVYLGLLGPSFETPAEISLFARWGLHAVGMSTVWEAIALRHSGATVGGLSLISNLGCGLSEIPLDHERILKESAKAAKMILGALFQFAETEFAADETV